MLLTSYIYSASSTSPGSNENLDVNLLDQINCEFLILFCILFYMFFDIDFLFLFFLAMPSTLYTNQYKAIESNIRNEIYKANRRERRIALSALSLGMNNSLPTGGYLNSIFIAHMCVF